MPIIEVHNVTKEFRLGQMEGLRTAVTNGLRRLARRPVQERPLFKALDDVSFTVEEGEVLGIIGHNGAGKSTLLKLLAGISKASQGRVNVRGKIAPLIEVGAGFVPEMTGRENVYLNGAILGLTRKEIDWKFDEIVSFAEMEEFIDTPVKRYSSGMKVKLAFSVATSIESEILIVDEVLAVGDLAFQRKCFDRMEDLIKRQGRTVLLVSHNLRQIQRLSSRVLLLSHGRLEMEADAKAVCDRFYEQSDHKIKSNAVNAISKATTSGEIELLDISLLRSDGDITERLVYGADCTIRFRLRVLQAIDAATFGFGFHTTDFLYLTTHNSEDQLCVPLLMPGEHEIYCKVRSLPLLPGVYSLRFGVTAGQAARTVLYGENLAHFQVVGDLPITVRDGFFALNAHWESRAEVVPATV